MDRAAFNAMLAQYATPEVSGNGRVSWDGGIRCVMPSVKLYGKCQQDTLTGKNLFDPNAEAVMDGSYYGYKQYFSLPKPFTLSISLKPGKALPTNSSLGRIVKQTEDSSNTANWLVLNGEINSEYDCKLVIKETDYYMEMIGVYPPSSLPSFLDALNIQIELGSTATAYEPYCGGIPAPNPSYPVPIKCNNGVYRATNTAGNYDGGQTAAPELYAIPGTEYRDEWNPKSGKGLRRIRKFVMDGVSTAGRFESVHNASPKDVFVVTQGDKLTSPNYAGENYGITNVTNILSNYFEYSTGYYANTIGAFKHSNAAHGIVCRLPYAMFGITKGEKTNDELLEIANNWLAQLSENGKPMEWYYPLKTPKSFDTTPARLTMPPGAGQIIQVGGDVADCPITARYLTHS